MSQNDFNLANQSGASIRADMNSALQALASASSGATEPATKYPYQLWVDTTANQLKMNNAAGNVWQVLADLDTTNNRWEPRANVIKALTTAGITFKNSAGTIIATLSDTGALTIPGALSAASVPLPARLGPGSKSVADWNSAVESGFYIADFAKNAPVSDYLQGFVYSRSPTQWVSQVAWQFNANADPLGSLLMWRREMNNGVWGSWGRIYQSKGDIDALIDAKIAAIPNTMFISPYATSPAQNSSVVFTHTLGAGVKLKRLQAFYKCYTAELGYSVGDIVEVGTFWEAQAGSGLVLYQNGSNIVLRRPNYPLYFVNLTTGGGSAITNTNWNVHVVAESI